jgi:chromosome segregation ATPase
MYRGIRVLVSFNNSQALSGDGDEVISQDQDTQSHQHSLSHLSGGQKAVVAACLIFAIQRIEPLPFYILDEFDSALDPLYCEGVAQ